MSTVTVKIIFFDGHAYELQNKLPLFIFLFSVAINTAVGMSK